MMYFVCYDIADRKRRLKTVKTLENFGLRVQYSFFQCEIKKEQTVELENRLLDNIDEKNDSLRIYPICEDCLRNSFSLGEGAVFVPKNYEIL